MDAGYRVAYAGDIAVLHPAYVTRPARGTRSTSAPATGSGSPAATCRCRSASLYVTSYALRTAAGAATPARARAALRGYRDGLREPCGARRRLRSDTLWRMTARPAAP